MKPNTVKILFSFLLMITFSFYSFADGNDPILKVGNSVNIKGKIIDKKTGEALTGVKVLYTGSEKSVYTDFDGEFTIDVIVKENAEISVSMISYETETIKLNKAEDFNFELIRQK
jgi:hypothetical protein